MEFLAEERLGTCYGIGTTQGSRPNDRPIASALPSDNNNVWPRRLVREALDEIRSEDISHGIQIGLRSLRGVIHREAGGTQERDIEKRYRRLAKKVEYENPFTVKMLVEIASSFKRESEWRDKQESVEHRLNY